MKLRDYLKEATKEIKSKEESQKFWFSSLKRFFSYIKEHWKKLAFGSFLMIVVSLLALPTPYIRKYIVGDIIAAKNIKYLHLAVLILLAWIIYESRWLQMRGAGHEAVVLHCKWSATKQKQ